MPKELDTDATPAAPPMRSCPARTGRMWPSLGRWRGVERLAQGLHKGPGVPQPVRKCALERRGPLRSRRDSRGTPCHRRSRARSSVAREYSARDGRSSATCRAASSWRIRRSSDVMAYCSCLARVGECLSTAGAIAAQGDHQFPGIVIRMAVQLAIVRATLLAEAAQLHEFDQSVCRAPCGWPWRNWGRTTS